MGEILDRMEPLLAMMPAVKPPEGHVHFKNKLAWTVAILILYFILANIPVFGDAAQIIAMEEDCGRGRIAENGHGSLMISV